MDADRATELRHPSSIPSKNQKRGIRTRRLLKNSRPNPFSTKSNRENIPSLDGAFVVQSKNPVSSYSEINGASSPAESSGNNSNYPSFPSADSSSSPDENIDRSTCSLSSSHVNTSMNLSVFSIGCRAALNEHRRHVARYGLDGANSPDKSLSRPSGPNEDEEWDRLLDGSVTHPSSSFLIGTSCAEDSPSMCNTSVIDSFVTDGRSMRLDTSTSNETSYSDFFNNSSRLNELLTPERNKKLVDEASRLARLGIGVTERNIEYEDDLEESESSFDEAQKITQDESMAMRVVQEVLAGKHIPEEIDSSCADFQKLSIDEEEGSSTISATQSIHADHFEASSPSTDLRDQHDSSLVPLRVESPIDCPFDEGLTPRSSPTKGLFGLSPIDNQSSGKESATGLDTASPSLQGTSTASGSGPSSRRSSGGTVWGPSPIARLREDDFISSLTKAPESPPAKGYSALRSGDISHISAAESEHVGEPTGFEVTDVEIFGEYSFCRGADNEESGQDATKSGAKGRIENDNRDVSMSVATTATFSELSASEKDNGDISMTLGTTSTFSGLSPIRGPSEAPASEKDNGDISMTLGTTSTFSGLSPIRGSSEAGLGPTSMPDPFNLEISD